MSLDFTAIDFETANSARASACAIGLVKIRNGREVSRISEIFCPPEGFDDFDPWNTMIHGITERQVRGKKRFGELWSEFQEFIGDDVLLAHNASFDLSVLRNSLKESELAWPQLNYLCSMVMAKPVFQLASYSLPIVARAAKIEFDESSHHDAAYDAHVSAQIVLKIAEIQNTEDLFDLCEKTKVSVGVLNSESWDACRILKPPSSRKHGSSSVRIKASEIQINQSADPDHPLFDKYVVFTGTLSSRTRPEAWLDVAALGAIPEENVTKSTNFLVVGEQDPTKFRAGDTTSSKYQKAEKLRNSGQDIEVIFERDFLALLEPVKG